jgi:hypothetical protein
LWGGFFAFTSAGQGAKELIKRAARAMKGFKDKGFADRLTAAAKAREAALEKFKSRPKPDDPEMIERAAARKAAAEARAAREAERIAEREARAEREASEAAARQVAEAAARAEAEAHAASEKERLAAEQKAARDARYAARKSRKS